MSTEADKDRRSRMSYSSVNAPPKKGGAGGAYTWGNAADVRDYEPTPVLSANVTTSAAPVVYQQPISTGPFTASLASTQQFPTLGAQPVQSPALAAAWTSKPTSVTMPAQAPQQQPVVTRVITTQAPAVVYTQGTQPVAMTSPMSPVGMTTQAMPSFTFAAPAKTASVAYVGEKDRRSRMSYSSVNAPPKKGGAGGAYTWGNAADVQDYEPTPVQQPNVTVAPAPAVYQQPVNTVPFTGSLSSAQQFPTLGAAPAQVPVPAAWNAVPQSVTSQAKPAEASTASSGLPAEAFQQPASPVTSSVPAPEAAVPSSPAPASTPASTAAVETSVEEKKEKPDKPAKEEGGGSSCSIQ
eukprot:TRINITY_DN91581_c0_g1_i1.p1 TRINITY_DN91581_c0_g1~~TRINITY_DN91581_c0_g1_i1.p1  ORF type:complete len:352 (-),score=78.55 TRINITY_DN91581_c0_g1_i1:102-1157(-)